MGVDLENAVALVEASSEYRVLRRLIPPAQYAEEDGTEPVRTAALVDVETTGLDTDKDDLIELGVVLFTYGTHTGRVFRVLEERSWFEDPGLPLPAEIVELTGITDEMVAGQRLPDEEVLGVLAKADLVIAHNAAFDRLIVERRLPDVVGKPWGCSSFDVPWKAEGYPGAKLEYLFTAMGYFTSGHHRAGTDCRMTLHVLAQMLPSGRTGLSHVLKAARQTMARLFAVGSPFDDKDRLKAAGYKWSDGANGWPRAWYRDVPEEEVAAAIDNLGHLSPRATPRWFRITARERYSHRMLG